MRLKQKFLLSNFCPGRGLNPGPRSLMAVNVTTQLRRHPESRPLVFVALPVLVVFDSFLHPDSSCKSILVSCQAVTSPLLIGEGSRWVLKDLFRRALRCPVNT